MTITAQTADGVQHEFPDGTPDAVIDKVMKAYKPQDASSAAKPPVSTGEDMARAVPAGLWQGATSAPNTVAQDAQMVAPAVSKVSPTSGTFLDLMGRSLPILMKSAGDAVGGNYEPQTGYGEVVKAATAFAPAALTGSEGSLMAQALKRGSRVLAPAAGSMAGQIPGIKGTAAEPYVSTAGSMIGALAGGIGEGYATNKFTPPDERGMQFVQSLAAKAGKSPDDLDAIAATDRTGQMTAAEALGSRATTHTMALARQDGQTGDTLAAQMAERGAGRPDRLLDNVANATGIDPAAARGDIKTVVANGRAKAAPLYDAAFAKPPVITDRLKAFATDQIVQKGMREGIRTEQLKALAKGEPFDPNAYAITDFNAAGDATVGPVPTWKSWDAAKIGLDDILEGYRDKTTGRLVLDKRGIAINDVRKAMLNELDSVNTEYATARATAGDYMSAQDAFDRGAKAAFNPNITEKQFADMVSSMSPGDVEALKGGLANRAFDMAQNSQLNPKKFLTPRTQTKFGIALGQQNASTLMDSLGQEMGAANFERLVTPRAGSQTMPLAQAVKEQQGFNANHAANTAIDFAADPKRAAVSKLAGVLQGVADKFKTGGLNEPARDAAGRLLISNPRNLADALRNARVSNNGNATSFPRQLLLNALLSQGGTP